METGTGQYDLKNVPDSWWDAADDAPQGTDGPLQTKRYVKTIPRRADLDFMIAMLAAMSMSGISGTAWYILETQERYSSQWLAVPLGFMIAVAVRLGGGAGNEDARAIVSAVFYVVTLIGTAYFIERFHIGTVIAASQLDGIERGLISNRLSKPATVLPWALGLFTAVQTSYVRANRRRAM